MEDRTKGWVSKLFTFAAFAALVAQGVLNVTPITKDGVMKFGVCNVTLLKWVQTACMRDSTFYFLYYAPQFQGYFAEIVGRPSIIPGTKFSNNTSSYTALYVNKSYISTRIDYNVKVLLYDDYSDKPLLNCSKSTEVTDTKKLIVQYIPTLSDVIDVNSDSIKAPSKYPDTYFNCSVDNLGSAFLQHQNSEKLLLIPFLVTLLAFIAGLFCITKYDIDGPIKELATLLITVLLMVVFVINFVFYFIICVVIGQIVCNKAPGDPEEFFKKGSIFIPLIWLYKKIRDKYRASRTTDTETTSSPAPASPSPARTRGSVNTTLPRTRRSHSTGSIDQPGRRASPSTPRRRTPPPEPSARPHAPHTKPPSYSSFETEGTVIPNSTVFMYHGDNLNNDDILPPPPSYDEAVNQQV